MNIFVLDLDPSKAARYHCDKHVVKMVVESCQIMSTVLRAHNVIHDGLYKSTHSKHPCVIWAGHSRENFQWLLNLTRGLLDEYTLRYNKIHKCEEVYRVISDCIEHVEWSRMELTPFALAMPDYCRCDEPVDSYRKFYLNEKKRFAKWKTREPEWWNE